MALTWTAKAPAEVVERRWTTPLAYLDALGTPTLTVTSGTLSIASSGSANKAYVVFA